ncbi:MAG: orotidine-5'-phosphate decarboxylase [Acidobacteria bacterium]|nr:MAG: orotidine-5'-phosphate decarboxylase [Acidobacteriota bacterium]
MTPELIVAVDVDTLDKALRLRDELSDVVDLFKVGKELFTAVGPRILEELTASRVFLDLKFHDIPNTVAGAVAVAARAGVSIVDVHAAGGRAMMEAASAAARKSAPNIAGMARPRVFGVTVLTHLADDDLREVGIGSSSEEQVVRLARLAAESGLDGVVASPLETRAVREATEGHLDVLVPGVRPAWAAASHDQKRVATPAEVARDGARYIVVGRAITRDEDPREAAKKIRDELESA